MSCTKPSTKPELLDDLWRQDEQIELFVCQSAKTAGDTFRSYRLEQSGRQQVAPSRFPDAEIEGPAAPADKVAGLLFDIARNGIEWQVALPRLCVTIGLEIVRRR
jgi:hypothetical protein